MIVLFISQCEKQAILKTNRILDSFADRIGDRTWKTIITQAGLDTVKKLLKKTASKNTAVACHSIHGRNDIDLLWIVGRRSAFNEDGLVPVHKTSKSIINTQWENDWHFHPLITSFVALASLFHDVGKANDFFQEKLRKKGLPIRDPLRHEWISVLILISITKLSDKTDKGFLEYLARGSLDIDIIIGLVQSTARESNPLKSMGAFSFFLAWLILTHHKLPACENEILWRDFSIQDYPSIQNILDERWGSWNGEDISKCIEFKLGTTLSSGNWIHQVQKWAKKALDSLTIFNLAIENNTIRTIMLYSRFCLMFGDYRYSSMDNHENKSERLSKLFANTDAQKNLKQSLEEHILGVQREALEVTHLLPRFEIDMDYAKDVRSLKRKAPFGSPFHWQDTAIEKIISWKNSQPREGIDIKYGFFVINIASTGCGKTYANAKIMQAISKDGTSLRYCLALGLRTLTLQTGDEYRSRIGLDNSELAVLIGSEAIKELHEYAHSEDNVESPEPLFDGDIDYESAIPESKLAILLRDEKARQLLYSPVLACTIDYLMMANESIKGGKWMLPFLRMMSSDLVLDEIDDFTGSDLIAIGRLIHLAGLLGRKVMISSATIPQDMAEGYFRAYCDGWGIYAQSRQIPNILAGCWVDEFETMVHGFNHAVTEDYCSQFNDSHSRFIKKRIQNLVENEKTHGTRRKARIVRCSELVFTGSIEDRQLAYFGTIKDEVLRQHQLHADRDPSTGTMVSFGVVRLAHINPCINLFKYFMSTEYPNDVSVRVMVYHSRQVLLLRSEQERHLDDVLKCADGTRNKAFSNPVIRSYLNNIKQNNLIFIVVCTPVEEVGRDHDFDWAVIEPSSFRSIIQMSGRVRRHRIGEVENPNISIMQYNLRGLENHQGTPVFCQPGYETSASMLKSHDMTQIVDEDELGKSINAKQRILRSINLRPQDSLIDLEQYAIAALLNDFEHRGPESMCGWLGSSLWWMTALPQKLNRFRQTTELLESLVYYFNNDEVPVFGIIQDDFIAKEFIYKIHILPNTAFDEQWHHRLWLCRDYITILEKIKEEKGGQYKEISSRFGIIQIPSNHIGFEYSDQFGMLKNQSV